MLELENIQLNASFFLERHSKMKQEMSGKKKKKTINMDNKISKHAGTLTVTVILILPLAMPSYFLPSAATAIKMAK